MRLPEEFISRQTSLLKDEIKLYLSCMENNCERALRVNPLKGSVCDFLSSNPFGITDADRVPWCPEGFYYKEESYPGRHPLFNSGAYYIQEPSAMSPVEELLIEENDKVLDLCASPGGKSTQIAGKLSNTGILVSNEPFPIRAKVLSENIERMGIANSIVVSHEPKDLSERFEGYFNKILVDAPCSGEGMFRKNPESIAEWSPENVLMCAERQKDILKEAVKMLSPGGRMVYSTCTFSKEENEDNVEWLLNDHPELKLIKKERLLPYMVRGEGHFYAVFEKEGNAPKGFLSTNGNNDKRRKADEKKYADCFDFEKENLNIKIFDIFNDGAQIVNFKDELHLVPSGFPSVDRLKVLRLGLHLGTLKKNRFEPSFALAMYLKPDMVKKSVSYDHDTAERYLKGESIPATGGTKDGWNLITVDGYSLGWGKASNNMMKNHYPKGLRINR